MNESACQRDRGIACGACCGVFNLVFDERPRERRHELLLRRTQEFAAVRFDQPETFVRYRQTREAAEQELPRHNPEIYVCPFFGYLEDNGRTGCLAHPARTGLAHTQNFSFYGASICQAYDCRNKDQDPEQKYSRLLARWFGRDASYITTSTTPTSEAGAASELYARLMADVPLYALLERLPGAIDRLLACEDPDRSPLRDFLRLTRARLQTRQSEHITSFEVGLERFSGPAAEVQSLVRDAREPIASAEAAEIVKNLLAAGTADSVPD